MDRDSKIIAIVALIVAVVGLGIGFAAFTANLTISSSAKVTPSASNFKVKFKESTLSCGSGSTTGSGSVSKTGTLNETSISGLEVTLTKPGDSVTCTATITAEGDYEAYLTAINTNKLTCNPKAGNTFASLGNKACEGIKATFSIGTATATATTQASSNAATLGESFKISKGGNTFGTQTLTIKIEYLSSATPTDEELNITVPTTTLVYETVKGATS